MLLKAPPLNPPRVALADDDDRRRLTLQLRLWSCTGLTILATAWLMSLGWVPGILGLVAAKHVLVALVLMGLGVDKPSQTR